jgi:glutamyl-tRNA synthetase
MVEDQALLPTEVLEAMEKGALQNAARHGGKAEAGALIGRVLAQFPELRSKPGPVSRAAKDMVARVNSMSISEQEELLRTKHGGEVSASPKEGRSGLPPLPNASRGKATFRLPPEPSGFMTIGHAMAFTINYLYRQTYQGELWLRFEDTNPRKVAPQYYESFRRGIRWLSIECDHEKNVSDDMELIYGFGRRLVEQGDAYACSCDEAKVKRLRFAGVPCEHRDNALDENLKVWNGLLGNEYKEGEYVVRLKGDMRSDNYSLRDTNLFRVIEHPHPLTGRRYSLWPTYDIANAVEDEVCGVTHVLRSSEFRTEVQAVIREKLKFRSLEVVQFSRFNFKGTPVKKRLLRPLVEKGAVTGWDDPRMPTVDGLMRRGILPQAIRDLTLLVGYTKAEHEYDWSILLSINRKLLDPVSKRVFFVPDPVTLEVEGAPAKEAKIPFHPQAPMGFRTVRTDGEFFVPGGDLRSMEKGALFRLMDLYNVILTEGGRNPTARYAGDELVQDSKKLQWVAGPGNRLKVLVPGLLFNEDGSFNEDSLREVSGVAEDAAADLSPGDIIQFPRFGFCRVDSPGVLIFSC